MWHGLGFGQLAGCLGKNGLGLGGVVGVAGGDANLPSGFQLPRFKMEQAALIAPWNQVLKADSVQLRRVGPEVSKTTQAQWRTPGKAISSHHEQLTFSGSQATGSGGAWYFLAGEPLCGPNTRASSRSRPGATPASKPERKPSSSWCFLADHENRTTSMP